jgi:TolA-binding protein
MTEKLAEPPHERIARLEREKSEALGRADGLEILMDQAERDIEDLRKFRDDFAHDLKNALERAEKAEAKVEALTQAADTLARSLKDMASVHATECSHEEECVSLFSARAALQSWHEIKEGR